VTKIESIDGGEATTRATTAREVGRGGIRAFRSEDHRVRLLEYRKTKCMD
jgi:hypothetical protein